MAARSMFYGKCFLCGKTLAKHVVSRHLKTCLPAHESGKGGKKRLFHIQVEGTYAPMYWLHLEIPASTTLYDLDDYLRAIWLQCCGHLSSFEIEGTSYELEHISEIFWSSTRPAKAMEFAKLGKILRPALVFSYKVTTYS